MWFWLKCRIAGVSPLSYWRKWCFSRGLYVRMPSTCSACTWPWSNTGRPLGLPSSSPGKSSLQVGPWYSCSSPHPSSTGKRSPTLIEDCFDDLIHHHREILDISTAVSSTPLGPQHMRTHMLEGVRDTAALAMTEQAGMAKMRQERLAEADAGGLKFSTEEFALGPWGLGEDFWKGCDLRFVGVGWDLRLLQEHWHQNGGRWCSERWHEALAEDQEERLNLGDSEFDDPLNFRARWVPWGRDI